MQQPNPKQPLNEVPEGSSSQVQKDALEELRQELRAMQFEQHLINRAIPAAKDLESAIEIIVSLLEEQDVRYPSDGTAGKNGPQNGDGEDSSSMRSRDPQVLPNGQAESIPRRRRSRKVYPMDREWTAKDSVPGRLRVAAVSLPPANGSTRNSLLSYSRCRPHSNCCRLSHSGSDFALLKKSRREGNEKFASSMMIQRKASYKLMLELSCSISQLPTQTSLTNIQPTHAPRFRRSSSGERARSKDQLRSTVEEAGFFIKNIFAPASLGDREEERKERRIARRQATPAKENKRRNLHMHEKQTESAVKSALARKCQQLTQLLQKSQSYTYELESRIASLERRRVEKDESMREDGTAQKEGRRSNKDNLAKMRKLIAETKSAEVAPFEQLSLQVKMLQAQNLCLRDRNSELLQMIRQNSEAVDRMRSEQQKQLQALISELKLSLKQRDKEAQGLRVELRMIKLKQSKQEQNREVTKNEEVAYLKFRYQNLRKKFQETNKALKAMEQKEKKSCRAKYLFMEKDQVQEFSFSLSP